jgi:hypothetical protein
MLLQCKSPMEGVVKNTSNVASSERRQSNYSDSPNQNVNNNQNPNSNLDLNNGFNVNNLDLNNLNAQSLDLNDIDINGILEQIQAQILEEQLLQGSSIDSLNELDLSENNDLQFNNFDLNQFNSIFDSQFSVQSVIQLLEGIDSSNIFSQNNLLENNNNIDLNSFASSFNDQFQSSWQSNEILAVIESISGNQNLLQLEDLAQLSDFSDNSVIETQIEEISI